MTQKRKVYTPPTPHILADENTVAKQLPITGADELRNKLTEAKKSDVISGLTDEQKDKAFEVIDLMIKQMDCAHSPELSEDCTIEMELMKGGKIKIVPPTGYHVMQGKRQMKLLTEKGDSEEMLPAYIMCACSDITELNGEPKPLAMHDMNDKLTARDFNVLLGFFCRINLL